MTDLGFVTKDSKKDTKSIAATLDMSRTGLLILVLPNLNAIINLRQFSKFFPLVVHSFSLDATFSSTFSAIFVRDIVDAVACNVGTEPLSVVWAVAGVLDSHLDSVAS